MAEGGANVTAYFMVDINCGSKCLHSGFIKVDKYTATVGDLLSEKIPEGYLISKVYIAEGEDKKRRHVPTDMQFGNLLYMNTNYRQFTVFVNNIEDC